MQPIFQRTLSSLFFVSAIVVSGCDSDDDAGTSNIDSGTDQPIALQWSPCEEDSRLECASLEVPMVHADPEGEKITLALNRLPTPSGARQGSLLFNPGGPGGSGLDLVFIMADEDLVPAAVRDAYDIVGFDPRGINKSTPVDCSEFTDEDIEDYPLDFSDLQSYEQDNALYVQQCVDKYGSYLQHLGSADVVDDMELIRKALGESQLDFIGYSYGTRLAGLYAQTYPTTTGRVVLDASLPNTHGAAELFEEQLMPHENNLRLFAEICQSHSDCDPVAYKQQIIDHTNGLISAGSVVELDTVGALLLTAIQEPQIASELSVPFYDYLQSGDFSQLETIVDMIEGADEVEFDEEAAQRAVICADDAARPSIEEVEALRTRFNEQSDLVAELQLIGVATCLGWPEALRPLPPIATDTAPELLVIAGIADSQTPAQWSERMAQAIGGRYLLSEHLGHTVVFNDSNSCVDQAVIDYLIDGVLPDQSVCAVP